MVQSPGLNNPALEAQAQFLIREARPHKRCAMVIKGVSTNRQSRRQNEATNDKSVIRQIETKIEECTHTHMKPKASKESKVQESDPVSK